MITILILTFSIFCHSFFRGQMWNLVFYKLVGIWYKDTLLYFVFIFWFYFWQLFFQFFLTINFYEEIWSQNLMFTKLTEIKSRCTFLCAAYNFDNYFFNFSTIHFLGKFGPKIRCSQNWNLVQCYIVICCLQCQNLFFHFLKYYSNLLSKFGPKFW